MKRRMTLATAVATVALVTLAGCQDDPSPADETTTGSPTTPATTPSVDPSTPAAVALQGDWQDVDAQWTVHFHEDGTFVEDFKGVTDFRVGKYAVDGTTVSLIGDDGNTDQGTINGETLVFELGTLTRM